MKQATTLQEILKVSEAKPLNDENFDDFFVETDDARGKNTALHLMHYFKSRKDDAQKVLFMGHRGSGKSTELYRLKNYLGDEFKVMIFSVKEIDTIDLNYIDMIFLIIDQLYQFAIDDRIEINKNFMASLDHFWNDQKLLTILNISKADIEGNIEAGGGFWNFIRLKIRGIFRTGVEIKEEIRQNCKPKVSQLIQQANDLIRNIKMEYAKRNQTVLVVVDDLDKLDIAIAEELFLRRSNTLIQFNIHIIYTFPIFLHYSDKFNSISEYFDLYELLSMIKTKNKDGSDNDSGKKILAKIIEKRAVTSLFEKDAIEKIISNSGGVLRHIFKMITDSVLLSLVAGSDVVTLLAAQNSFIELKSTFERSIEACYLDTLTQLYHDKNSTPLPDAGLREAYPKVGGAYEIRSESAIKNLFFMADLIRFSYAPPTFGYAGLREMLNCMAIIEYNGERWCGLHPAVEKMLEERGLRCISK